MFWAKDRCVSLANIATTLSLAGKDRFITKGARSGNVFLILGLWGLESNFSLSDYYKNLNKAYIGDYTDIAENGRLIYSESKKHGRAGHKNRFSSAFVAEDSYGATKTVESAADLGPRPKRQARIRAEVMKQEHEESDENAYDYSYNAYAGYDNDGDSHDAESYNKPPIRGSTRTLDALVNALIRESPKYNTPTEDAIEIVIKEHPAVNIKNLSRLLEEKPEIAPLIKSSPRELRLKLIETEMLAIGLTFTSSAENSTHFLCENK